MYSMDTIFWEGSDGGSRIRGLWVCFGRMGLSLRGLRSRLLRWGLLLFTLLVLLLRASAGEEPDLEEEREGGEEEEVYKSE